ncbi:MAG: hypothetical protein ACPLKZ_07450 [Candidatus Bathyarchaeales archaeon]
MTKHSPEEIAAKCPLGLEEAYKLKSGPMELIDRGALAICSAGSEKVAKSEVALVVVQEVERSRLEKALSSLYDLENGVCEKPLKLKLDLDLYQMESL